MDISLIEIGAGNVILVTHARDVTSITVHYNAINASQDDKEKILNILQRLNESESMHEDKDLNVVWEKLSEKEKQDFEQCLTNGNISRLISLWQPWWRTNVAKGERIKVVDNDDDGKSQVKQNGLLPKLHRDFLSPESIGSVCKL
ncbi:uncharacterized protein TRIADDRAFT_51336 [Trichoplax adhaerens]|uniref:Uncharacterized protein n=1 Tax=Trichoplax adhaerens TaxID=10228 RepID=B3RIJ1_TRIAD|nr:hypothetical protein TRIADDRAFT_51336 [Trichoplax adhaerens]EDV28431.1 hypothetical protein TRIADDRAFT_51336 [Trichoplax adhaerens]|eukprot:XP_002107633.1 hypothetical protein TRIADDRAFT_51336 [Trichoplax adhaerens]